MEWNAERAKLAQQKAETEEEEADSERYLPPAPKKFDTGDENFAKELTEGQKLLLTNMMLSRKRPKPVRGYSSDDTAGMNRGDRELIELVRRWGDSRVATNILDQIRYDSSDPNLNADLMGSVATILNDQKLTNLAEQYSEIQWRDEDDEMDAEETEEPKDGAQEPDIIIVQGRKLAAAETTPTGTVNVPDEEFAEKVPDESAAGDDAVQPKNEPKKKTYGDVRSELMKTFLDRADRLIARKEKADAKD
jgi:hypothetical protein